MVDKRYNRTPAETFAPTIRHNTFKPITAAGVYRAAKTGRAVRFQSGDVSVAFLRGTQSAADKRVLRPPRGFRSVDRRGVPIVWELSSNLYGESSAPRIWHQTALEYCVNDPTGPQLRVRATPIRATCTRNTRMARVSTLVGTSMTSGALTTPVSSQPQTWPS